MLNWFQVRTSRGQKRVTLATVTVLGLIVFSSPLYFMIIRPALSSIYKIRSMCSIFIIIFFDIFS